MRFRILQSYNCSCSSHAIVYARPIYGWLPRLLRPQSSPGASDDCLLADCQQNEASLTSGMAALIQREVYLTLIDATPCGLCMGTEWIVRVLISVNEYAHDHGSELKLAL